MEGGGWEGCQERIVEQAGHMGKKNFYPKKGSTEWGQPIRGKNLTLGVEKRGVGNSKRK